MARYAEDTTVSIKQSRADVESLVERYGARKFAFGYDGDKGIATVLFELHDRRVQFRLRMPEKHKFDYTPTGKSRATSARDRAWEQECRRLWRSLVLVLKAKLEAVASGVETFEEAFLAQIVLPDGRTYGDVAIPQIGHVYETRQMPPMLPGVDPSVLALGRGQA